MSRIGEYMDAEYPNQGDLWWANVARAMGGRRGQLALRELELALLALPEPKLISSHLAHNGQVCTVGALALHKRTAAGEAREDVLAELEAQLPVECETCWHTEAVHRPGEPCPSCLANLERWWAEPRNETNPHWAPRVCREFVPAEWHSEDGALVTAQLGRDIGLTFTLAWHLAYMNDEEFGSLTPEQRYTQVLAWVRRAQRPLAA